MHTKSRWCLVYVLAVVLWVNLAPADGSASTNDVLVAQNHATAQQATPPAQHVPESQGNPDVKVWVNTASGVYHCPGTRWYGATKRGEYMTQAEAQKKGYRPAYGKVCQ